MKPNAESTPERQEIDLASFDRASAEVMYAHTVDVAKTFLDWRHKVMTFTFAVSSALITVAAWMYNHNLERAIAVPLLMAGLLCGIASVFDARNQQILYEAYHRSGALEAKLGCQPVGALSHIRVDPARTKDERLTYHWVLKKSYQSLAVAFVVGAVLVAFDAPEPPPRPAAPSTTGDK